MSNHDMDSAVYVQKCPNDELPEGDAVSILRRAADSDTPMVSLCDRFDAAPLLPSEHSRVFGQLADMVERDYVHREAYEDLRDEFTWTNSFLHRIGKQCGTKDVPSLKAYVEKLEARVEELEAIDRRIAETDSRWEAATRDLERMTAERDELRAEYDKDVLVIVDELDRWKTMAIKLEAERDEWKAKAEQAQESYLDAKQDRDAWMAKAMDAHESCRQHADQGEHLESPDCESDSCEKLEAEIDDWCAEHFNSSFSGKAFNLMLRWLNRQAAITERHWMEIVGASANCNLELTNQIAELTEQLESAHAKNRALKAHIAKMQEGRHGWHIKGKELQEKVDSLTQANGDLRDEWHRVCRERDELQRKLHESNRERERLRKQLGIAIDHAHDMIALVSLDGDTE